MKHDAHGWWLALVVGLVAAATLPATTTPGGDSSRKLCSCAMH